MTPRRRHLRSTLLFVLLTALPALIGSGCGPAEPAEDGPDDRVAMSEGYTQCQLEAVVSYLNSLKVADLQDAEQVRADLRAQGLHSSAARCLVWFRLGLDTTSSCPTSWPAERAIVPAQFVDAEQVDAVKYVGPVAIQQLVELSAGGCTAPATVRAEVVFSPAAKPSESHAARLVKLIEGASRNLDIAMYSFSQADLVAAVLNKAGKVPIRVIYDKSHLGGSLEKKLEEAGIEVRYVGQTMHHKLAIIDGVHAEGDNPADTTVVTGSANWSNGAVILYDEATLFVQGSPEIAYRYQKEFNLLWDQSYAVPGHEEIPPIPVMAITDEQIAAVDDPALNAVFTSSNFYVTSSGQLQVKKDGYDVAQVWIDTINSAQSSIFICSERLRSVPIAAALAKKAAENPNLQIRVYMDNQDFVRADLSASFRKELEDCYAKASTATQKINCESGMYYSYELQQLFEQSPFQGLRFKYYAYNWHYSQPQMHNKSMIVDNRYILSGSYNLSQSSEFSTFENVMILDGQAFPKLLDAYTERFEMMWSLGEEEGAYQSLMEKVTGSGDEVPILFDPLSLTWSQVDALRTEIWKACGSGQLGELKNDNPYAQYCLRQ